MRGHAHGHANGHAHGHAHGRWRWRERALQQILFRASFGAIVASAIASFLVVHFASRVTRGPWLVPLGVLGAAAALWVVSAILARRLARPLRALVDTARRIGAGDLSARARLGWHGFAEVRVLADALGDMAGRLEQQIADQRALLAGASHELRTPLQHMKLLVEILRAQPTDKALADLEREIDDVDALVGKLLASSRLEFDRLDRRSVEAGDLARRALERAHLEPSLLSMDAPVVRFDGDPTVLVRALENLLENARDHGGGVTALRVESARENGAARVSFTVEDRGPGLPVGEEHKVLEPFFHRASTAGAPDGPDGPGATAAQAGGLGLGLHLVRRIAQAHGGDAFAHNREGGGAAVGFFVRA